MSRIHDALKRAEQEKAEGVRPGGPAGAVEPAAPEPVLGPGSSEVPQEAPTPSLVRSDECLSPITWEVLEARCVRRQWNPDSKTLLVSDSQAHALGAEEFRTLRSQLYLIHEKQALRTLLITSALPQEGKTFIAANLANIIVRQPERRVLLVDADLRWSRLHQVLGAPSTPGLSDYLQGEAEEFSILQRGPQGNLFFIPGGKAAPNPAELIANGRLKSLLQRLAPVFDWIILDSPPVVPVSDSSLLAGSCDGVLMVVRAGATPFDMAQRARDEFRSKRLLGVVLNGVAPGAAYGSYYYGAYAKDAKKSKRGGQ